MEAIKLIYQLMPRFRDLDWPIQKSIMLSCLLLCFMMGINISIPFCFKYIIDLLSQSIKQRESFIYFILFGYGLSWAISQCIIHVRSLITFCLLERSMRILSVKIFDHLLSLSMRFHNDKHTGSITDAIARAQAGLEIVFWGIISFLIPLLGEMFLVLFVMSYFYGALYGCTLFIMISTYTVFSFFVMEKAIKIQEKYNKKRSDASAYLVDNLLNIETIKYFNNQRYERDASDRLFEQQETLGIKHLMVTAYIQCSQAAILGLGILIVTMISGKSVYAGIITIGDFVLINHYLKQFTMPLSHFGYIVHQVRKGIQDMKEIIKILHIQPEVYDASSATDLITSVSDIIFDNVWFGYDINRDILKGVTFSVPAGSTVAIVGATGSGKSTIARLLFRLYDIQKGTITINNHDISHVTQQSLHKMIGIVPQDIILFNNSLYYNIAYGCPYATEKDVERVIRLVHLKAFIDSLPEGYHTIVGERGLKISGGEKQRIGIARALLKNPSIFIFDEATSSLDSYTEAEIQKNLIAISGTITTIIIAHRLSTITHAHRIIVLDDGAIVEQGTHQQLLNNNRLYTQLWNKQYGERDKKVLLPCMHEVSGIH